MVAVVIERDLEEVLGDPYGSITSQVLERDACDPVALQVPLDHARRRASGPVPASKRGAPMGRGTYAALRAADPPRPSRPGHRAPVQCSDFLRRRP